jgi:hypothetical protein
MIMFNNYTLGVHSSSSGCVCNSGQGSDVISTVSDYSVEDKYGNIVRLNWSPSARFTINLTSDIWAPIAVGAKVLSTAGATPYKMAGTEGAYVYNTNDCKCWKYVSGRWVEEADIAEFPDSGAVVLFSTKNCITRVSIKNFRGESIFSIDENSNIVNLQVDDTLSNILMQGFYNLDIYKIYNNETRLVRRIPLSVGYSNENSSSQGSVHVQRPNKGFTTDDTLNFTNGVLSVNTSNGCYYGSSLPISSSAVFEYAQPRNIIVELDDTGKHASISSIDIYNHVISGGNVLCAYDNNYYDFAGGTSDTVVFKSISIDNGALTERTIEIDSSHNSIVSISSVQVNSDNNDTLASIMLRLDEIENSHDTDMSDMRTSMDDISYRVASIKEQVGDIDVDASLELMRNQLNNQTDSIAAINTEVNRIDLVAQNMQSQVDDVKVILSDAVTRDEMSDIVEQAIDDDKLRDIVSNVIANEAILDGGVIR